ncbi:endonuclease VII domain-containing protein [Streptomyces achromogenes]|uniref:endonuclease VII domain-containing protein n=1 Tax=Streptomyces achromogenes TaxID=67255 RepID=UPI003700237B
MRSEGVPDGVLICAQPTRQNPNGRTGTPAGYVTHMKHGDSPCAPCREGHAAAQHARYMGDRQRFNDEHRLWRYGITLAQYEEMLAAQGGGCAICAATEPGGRGEKFHIDHDHACCPGIRSCGSCIRGLLCTGCNTALGGFRDDPKRLLAAVAYLTARKGAKSDAVH